MPKQIPIVDYLVLGEEPHLKARECESCGALYFERRNACSKCESREFGERALERTGTLRSFTLVYRSPAKVPTPYASAVIELDGGGFVKANVVNVEANPEQVQLNMPVAMTTFAAGSDDDGTEAIAFGFEPRKEASA